jgi:hypothetical protein
MHVSYIYLSSVGEISGSVGVGFSPLPPTSQGQPPDLAIRSPR